MPTNLWLVYYETYFTTFPIPLVCGCVKECQIWFSLEHMKGQWSHSLQVCINKHMSSLERPLLPNRDCPKNPEESKSRMRYYWSLLYNTWGHHSHRGWIAKKFQKFKKSKQKVKRPHGLCPARIKSHFLLSAVKKVQKYVESRREGFSIALDLRTNQKCFGGYDLDGVTFFLVEKVYRFMTSMRSDKRLRAKVFFSIEQHYTFKWSHFKPVNIE